MSRLILAACTLAIGLAVSAPSVRADFAVIQFADRSCKIWWDSADNPAGAGWTKLTIGLPDREAAWATLNGEIAQGVCR